MFNWKWWIKKTETYTFIVHSFYHCSSLCTELWKQLIPTMLNWMTSCQFNDKLSFICSITKLQFIRHLSDVCMNCKKIVTALKEYLDKTSSLLYDLYYLLTASPCCESHTASRIQWTHPTWCHMWNTKPFLMTDKWMIIILISNNSTTSRDYIHENKKINM